MTMQSIRTKYLPATNTRGSRIRVTASGRKDSVLVPWNHALDVEPNMAAALRFAIAAWGDGWTRHPWYGGDAKDGMVWVCSTPTAPTVLP